MSKFSKTIMFPAMAFFACALMIACNTGQGKTGVSVGAQGSVEGIRIPENADATIKYAASELQSYFAKITGFSLPIDSSGLPAKTPGQTIELSAETDSALKWDGFRIVVSDKGIRLTSMESRGILYAAYALLETAGCSFFYPGEKEEIIPRQTLLSFTAANNVINPILEHRGLAPYGLQGSSIATGRNFINWMAKNRMNYILVSENRPSDSDGPAHGSVWKETTGELLPELKKRDFIVEMSEHCTPEFFPRSLFQAHPDWFALNNGKRKLGPPPYSGQICYSNKEAIEYYGTELAKYAQAHPEFHTIGTWPLDGGQYCECENCKDPQTVFNAVLRVAEKIKAVRPDMIVEHLAYQVQTQEPPGAGKIPKEISVLWCPDAGAKDDLAKQWVEKAGGSGGVYQFEYYLGDNYRSRSNVWLRPRYAADIVTHANSIGFKGVISLYLPMQSWWRSSFNSWFFARSCWKDFDGVEKSMQKYCAAYYGAQASAASEIFELIFTKLQKEPFSESRLPDTQRLQEIRNASADINAKVDAAVAAAKDPVVVIRLKHIKTYVEFFALHAEAYATLKEPGLQKIIDYSKAHPEEDMVLMYPGYVKWRNEEYFPPLSLKHGQ